MPTWTSGQRNQWSPVTRRRAAWVLTLAVAVFVCALTVVRTQRIFSGFYGFAPPKFPTSTTYDGQFNFCRAMFESDRREKQGWGTDYPGADLNFSTRLAELTKVPVKRVMDGKELVPDAVVVRLTDDWLFKCSLVLMEDAGTARFSDAEVQRLRAYLLKGGFLLSTDYHGSYARRSSTKRSVGSCRPGNFPSSTSRHRHTRSGTRCSR